jgi:DNA-binding beta-propeller fold protein YncE
VELSRDGLVYVSDRDSQRVQVFDRAGRYKAQVFVHRNAASRQTASGLGLSADRDQRWLYVLDFGNGQMEIFDRKTLAPVGDIGGPKPGAAPGEFTGPHLMAVNSKGVIYVAEVQGRRVQRLTPKP